MSINLKISIIIPIYNVQVFLPKCLDSIVCQTYKNIEVICVNDGSTDNSEKIAMEYAEKDSRINVYSKPNGGLSSARNYGLEKATGYYTMFVDGDDWIDSRTCSEAIEKMVSQNADVVFWSYIREFFDHSKIKDVLDKEEHKFTEEECRILHRRLFGLVNEELKYPDKGDSLVTAWGKLYKSDILNGIRFVDTKIIGTEDALFNIQVFANVRCAFYMPVYYYHYRKYNSQSLTTKYNPHLYERWQTMYHFMANEISSHGYSSEYKEALYNRRALGLIALCQNVVSSDKRIFVQIRELKGIISDVRYRRAFRKLKIQYLPFVWKIFFGLAKHNSAMGVFCLAIIMQKIREKG